jgi:hypothetical protein
VYWLGGGSGARTSTIARRLAALLNGKGKGEAMTDIVIEPEEEILRYEVFDEALEATAGSEEGAYTLGSCTG